MLTTISKCNKCDRKADAKDGNELLCSKHWFDIYGGYGKYPVVKEDKVIRLYGYKSITKNTGNL